jgi:hypothetical protein
MKHPIAQWFEQSMPSRGILAGGLRLADNATTARSWSDAYPKVTMDNVLRCVADIYQVLPVNGLPQARLRLVYHSALLHCERGADGSCLGVFTLDDHEGYDAAGLDEFFKQFRVLSGAKPA